MEITCSAKVVLWQCDQPTTPQTPHICCISARRSPSGEVSRLEEEVRWAPAQLPSSQFRCGLPCSHRDERVAALVGTSMAPLDSLRHRTHPGAKPPKVTTETSRRQLAQLFLRVTSPSTMFRVGEGVWGVTVLELKRIHCRTRNTKSVNPETNMEVQLKEILSGDWYFDKARTTRS